MAYEQLEHISVDVTDGVAWAVIDHPPINLWDAAFTQDLIGLVSGFGSDDASRVLVLTSADPDFFLAHADVGMILEMDPANQGAEGAPAPVNLLLDGLSPPGKVSMALVRGVARGGGSEIALSCDMRFATPGARFAQPEVGLGIIPGAGGTQRLPRIVGLGRAKEMILTGARWDAARALEVGLVSRVVPLADLMPAARALADQVLALGPLAVRLAKAALNASSQMPLSAGLVFESTAQAITFESYDKMEGTTAFLEKRNPVFRGD